MAHAPTTESESELNQAKKGSEKGEEKSEKARDPDEVYIQSESEESKQIVESEKSRPGKEAGSGNIQDLSETLSETTEYETYVDSEEAGRYGTQLRGEKKMHFKRVDLRGKEE